jgi:N-6 DNA Methylase
VEGKIRLSWNEIRHRATKFAQDWKDAHYEKGETQTFYNDFFEVFGIQRRKVATFEEPVKRAGSKAPGFIDLFWKGTLLVEQKSAGRDLTKAKEQALEYFPGIKDTELPRYVLVCDFQTFELYDLDTREEVKFKLADLHKNVHAFSFIFGGAPRVFKDQDPVNIEASELMGKLHDALLASGYAGHDLERFLVRLVFCLFADDTGIFAPKGIFLDFVRDRTSDDGSDLGPLLGQLFEVLNRPTDKRHKTLDEDLKQFEYINGDLFAERLPMPDFDSAMRRLLLDACAFNWSVVSPAIFGALFQSVMDKQKRRAIGAHYTTEQNILKLIHPLFLDDLRTELDRLRARRDTGQTAALKAFQKKLAAIRCFDPACGCGNFLVIAYRELRVLETEVLVELNRNRAFDVMDLSQVDVNQFYGIEIEEFPVRIAEIALWMMDHIMNMRLSEALGGYFPRFPLKASPTIKNADALEMDWATVLDPVNCTYVLGNPPFGGAKYQTAAQRAQVARAAALVKKQGTLDYVAAWFIKAGAYIQNSTAKIAFVATSSITQGEQVAELWPLLFHRYNLEITFAHRTFAWGSEARGKAHVHVVIIGLALRDQAPKNRRIFDYAHYDADPTESVVPVISPYLFNAANLADPHTVVYEQAAPFDTMPSMIIGSKPIDDGNYILSDEERNALIMAEPRAGTYLHPYIGSEEFINGGSRWILALHNATPSDIRAMKDVHKRVEAVRAFRKASKSAPTQKLAEAPTLYHVNVIPKQPFLVVPEVSSEQREYVPIGYLQPPVIPSNLVRVIENASPALFGLITSRMHMAWMRYIGGRLESRYRYSIGLVYNPFPWPVLSPAAETQITKLAQAVLDARANYPNSTLGDLYDPAVMPADLRKAHQALDAAVDKLYRKEPFTSDRERVEFLLARYEKERAPLIVAAQPARKRRRKQT